MELLFNDCSIHGQFTDISNFRDAIGHVMIMRQLSLRFGREIYCNRNMTNSKVTQNLSMQSAVQRLNESERRAIMQWLTRQGPFWEDNRRHSPDDYLECNGDVVTDTAVGEAAFCCWHGINQHLVSIKPSSWIFSPIQVDCIFNGCSEFSNALSIEIINHWTKEDLEHTLSAAPAPLESWEQLESTCRLRFSSLNFLQNSFAPLYGHPFSDAASRQIIMRLDVLDRFKCCFDENGIRTPEGQKLYQDHFTGDRAWFSDSSDSEKETFRYKLTFSNPDMRSENLFCPWHGKVKTHQIRIHFSWPITAHNPLYIVYIGRKITIQ